MEGLEAAEIPWSALERTKRLDAEYFLKEHLFNAALLRKHGTRTVASCTDVSDGNHFSVSDQFVDEGFPYYRGQDVVGHFFIEQSAPVSITHMAYDAPSMKRSHLKKGDVLLSIVGSIGEASLVSSDRSATCSCKLAILRPRQIEPAYLASFLRSKYGRRQTQRLTRGAVQMGLLLEDMDQVLVPEVSNGFETSITAVIADSKAAIERAESSIAQAELALLHALGLENWQDSEPLSYIRNSSDVFESGRFDAEYFYPAKTAAQGILIGLSDCTVGSLFDSIRNLWQPADNVSSEQVRNYDLTDALSPFLNGAKEPVECASIASTKKTIQAGDLVVSRLRSYLKEIAIVQPSDSVPMVASTEFIVLRPKPKTTLPVEVLLIYLRSALPQLIFKWSQDGSNHPRFDERELLSLPVPRALIVQADKYVLAVREMISARERATQLLDAAKRAVEIAIEASEAAALAYLEGVNP